MEGQIVWSSSQQIKPAVPGDFWQVERPQVAPVLQEHGVAACPQEGKDPPGPEGAPAIHLPCKAACKALEFLPKLPAEDGELEIQSLQRVVG